jgi:hypothetical protein
MAKRSRCLNIGAGLKPINLSQPSPAQPVENNMNYKNPVDEEKKWVNLLRSIANPDLLDEQDRNDRLNKLVQEVLSKIYMDIHAKDLDALENLLKWIPSKNLLVYLDEERRKDRLVRLANPFPTGDKS